MKKSRVYTTLEGFVAADLDRAINKSEEFNNRSAFLRDLVHGELYGEKENPLLKEPDKNEILLGEWMNPCGAKVAIIARITPPESEPE